MARSYDPFEATQREFDTLLSRWFDNRGGDGAVALAPYGVDVREDQDHIYVEAELPGFRKEDVDITLEHSTLTIIAERTGERGNGHTRIPPKPPAATAATAGRRAKPVTAGRPVRSSRPTRPAQRRLAAPRTPLHPVPAQLHLAGHRRRTDRQRPAPGRRPDHHAQQARRDQAAQDPGRVSAKRTFERTAEGHTAACAPPPFFNGRRSVHGWTRIHTDGESVPADPSAGTARLRSSGFAKLRVPGHSM